MKQFLACVLLISSINLFADEAKELPYSVDYSKCKEIGGQWTTDYAYPGMGKVCQEKKTHKIIRLPQEEIEKLKIEEKKKRQECLALDYKWEYDYKSSTNQCFKKLTFESVSDEELSLSPVSTTQEMVEQYLKEKAQKLAAEQQKLDEERQLVERAKKAHQEKLDNSGTYANIKMYGYHKDYANTLPGLTFNYGGLSGWIKINKNDEIIQITLNSPNQDTDANIKKVEQNLKDKYTFVNKTTHVDVLTKEQWRERVYRAHINNPRSNNMILKNDLDKIKTDHKELNVVMEFTNLDDKIVFVKSVRNFNNQTKYSFIINYLSKEVIDSEIQEQKQYENKQKQQETELNNL